MKYIVMIMMILMSFGAAFGADDFDFGALDITLLNQDPDPAQPGEYVELRFKVEKVGNEELSDISFELQPQYPFSFDASDTPVKELGDWKVQGDNSQYYTLYYKLRVDENALEDTYNVSLLQKANGISSSREFEIRVDEPRDIELAVGSVQTQPRKLVPNYQDAQVDIELVNIGEEDAYQVIAEMKLVDGIEESFGYSNRVTLGTLESGLGKTASFYIDTLENLTNGVHETLLEVTYKDRDDNVVETIEIPFDLRVFGKPQYDVVETQVTQSLVSGSTGEVFVELQNIGKEDADLVSIQIFKDSTQPFSFDERSDFIGKLDQGDSGQAVFTFDVDEGAQAKEYRLTMQIRSIVDGEVFVEEKELIIPVQEGEASSSLPIIPLVVGVIVGGIAGFFIGKRNLKK